MTWQILRTVAGDDPDFVEDGVEPVPDDLIFVGALRRSPEGRFAARAAWVDALGNEIVNGAGTVSMQLVTVDQVPTLGGGILTLVSVSPPATLAVPPITGAREPMTFESLSMSGMVSVRCSDMAPPSEGALLQIFVETVD